METGIYILITKDGYRVTYSNQYTNLFGRYDDATNNFEINTEVLLQEFGDCFVFHHKEPAQQEADNGIMNINYSRYTFEELINGSKKKTLA
jgi:hypothetical protein